MSVQTRIDRRFAALKREGRAGLIAFVTAGDPDAGTSREILEGLPGAGADLIELGMPFSDPMADGPAIQASSQRALKAGASLSATLAMVKHFRAADATAAGVDGLLVVDMPPEEEGELCLPAIEAGMSFIFLTAPTTDDARLPRVLEHTSGFVYYVSITGITGTKSAAIGDVRAAVERLRRHTELPVAVGFGIKTPGQAAAVAAVADAAVVGSALVDTVADNLDEAGKPRPGLAAAVLALVGDLARGVRGARMKGAAQ